MSTNNLSQEEMNQPANEMDTDNIAPSNLQTSDIQADSTESETITPDTDVQEHHIETEAIADEGIDEDESLHTLEEYLTKDIRFLVTEYAHLSTSEILEGKKANIGTLGKAIVQKIIAEKELAASQVQDITETEETTEEVTPTPVKSEIEIEFSALQNAYRKRLKLEKEAIETFRKNNLEKKKALNNKLKSLSEGEDNNANYDLLKEIQAEWKAIGPVQKEEADDLYKTFHSLIDRCYDQLKISRELMLLDMQKNLDLKIELCVEAEKLIAEDSIKKSVDSLNRLHEQWKEIGPVVRDKKEEVWLRFKAASDRIYDKRKIFYNSLNDQREGNLNAKQAICEQVEELVKNKPTNHQEWTTMTQGILAFQEQWKEIGFAPKNVNNEIWSRFKAACDDFFTAKNLHYKSLRDDQSKNLNEKVQLCEKAEELATNEDWKSTANEFIKLQAEWKKVGPISKKHSDKLWHRFRAACDSFFNRKNEHFAGQDTNQEENLELKLKIIDEVENFQLTGNSSDDIDTLKALQQRWMEIGFVPIKQKKDLQERYRAAVNNHFDALKLNQLEKSKIKYQSRLETISHSDDGNKFLKKEHRELMVRISNIENDIALWENNKEFFSASKNADALRKEIDLKIAKAKEELVSLKEKLKILKTF